LYSNKISKLAVWASFIVGVGLTTSNMFLGFIDSPVNCGALAMLLSLVIVPVVSLITPSVDFDVTPRRRVQAAVANEAPAREVPAPAHARENDAHKSGKSGGHVGDTASRPRVVASDSQEVAPRKKKAAAPKEAAVRKEAPVRKKEVATTKDPASSKETKARKDAASRPEAARRKEAATAQDSSPRKEAARNAAVPRKKAAAHQEKVIAHKKEATTPNEEAAEPKKESADRKGKATSGQAHKSAPVANGESSDAKRRVRKQPTQTRPAPEPASVSDLDSAAPEVTEGLGDVLRADSQVGTVQEPVLAPDDTGVIERESTDY
jgi:hypothetical protein